MIVVKEVETKKDLKQFVEFPNQLYKNNPYYCPPLASDERNTFTPSKNPVFDFCESKQFLAFHDGKLVGRLGAIISYAHIKKQNKNQIRFTRFDAINDFEVTQALFREVVSYAKSKSMDEIIGPLGFVDTDREGMLIDGFDEYNLSITIYNAPYYQEHMKQLGFVKDVDWVEYQLKVPETVDPRIERIAQYVSKKYGYHMVHFKNNKEIIPYARQAFAVINEASEKLYATVPLTDRLIEQYLKDYIPIVNKDYVYVVCDINENVIGFGLMVPSIADACHKTNGHLFPFGWIHFLKALKSKKNDVLEMYFIAVRPELQNTGVNSLILSEAIKTCIKNHIRIAETGPELELNQKVQSQWTGFDVRQHRRRRSWIAKIDELNV